MLAEREVCVCVFFLNDPMDGANVIACVSRVMSGALLVFLGSDPDPLVELYHWLQGEGTGGLVTSR